MPLADPLLRLEAGNLVPDDVPVDDDEDHNLVVDTNGVFEREDWMLSHYDLVTMAGSALLRATPHKWSLPLM